MNSPVILITGAGKGIGKAMVHEIIAGLISSKPHLVLTSRTVADLESLQASAQQAGLSCSILPLELGDDPVKPVIHAVQMFGRIDQVIHCAGVGRFGDFLELTREDLEFVMKTNVEATFLMFQAAYAQMKKQKPSPFGHQGDLVCITSVAGEKPFEHSSIYCMSKYAQQGLMDVMRLYARKDKIRIIDVKPGATITPMWGETSAEMREKMMEGKDVAQLVLAALQVHPRASAEEILIRPIAGDL